MPGRGSYGPAGKWIHDRAHRIMEDSPETPKNVAYAIATQQGHKVGKSPKGFRTAEGVREAKKKYELPKKEYQKTAAVRLNALFDEIEKTALVGLGESGNALMPQFAGQVVPGGIPSAVQAAVSKAHVNLPSYAQRAGLVSKYAPKGGSALRTAAKPGLLGRLLKRAEAFPGWVGPIEEETEDNTNFRKVLFTGKNSQLVLMSIPVGGEIGEESHADIDQFFRVDGGEGEVVMEGMSRPIEDGDAFVVPAGTRHNVINTSEDEPLQLYSIYSPPNHPPGTLHETREDALEAEASGQDEQPNPADIVPGKDKQAAGGGGAALGGELLGLPGGIYGGLREAGLRGALGAGLGGGAGLAGGIGARHLIQKYLTGGEFGRRHPIAATIAESLPLAVGSTVGGAVGSQLLKR